VPLDAVLLDASFLDAFRGRPYLYGMRTWLKWGAFWTVLGLVSSTQRYFAEHRFAAEPSTWPQVLAASLLAWYLWGLLSLGVAWLGRRFQLDRANFDRHFIIHLGASLDFALIHLVAAAGIQSLIYRTAGASYPFAERVLGDFTLYYHWNVLTYWAILAVVHALDYHHALEAHRNAGEAPAVEAPVERLLVGENGRSFFVRTGDVEWIEAAKNYVRLHVDGRTHTLRTTLSDLERRLDPARFRRVNRSALVNLDRVRELQPWFHGDAVIILHSGSRLSLSRRYRDNLVDAAR
jgi:LytTr DNA-binding domain-containing protein